MRYDTICIHTAQYFSIQFSSRCIYLSESYTNLSMVSRYKVAPRSHIQLSKAVGTWLYLENYLRPKCVFSSSAMSSTLTLRLVRIMSWTRCTMSYVLTVVGIAFLSESVKSVRKSLNCWHHLTMAGRDITCGLHTADKFPINLLTRETFCPKKRTFQRCSKFPANASLFFSYNAATIHTMRMNLLKSEAVEHNYSLHKPRSCFIIMPSVGE